MEELARRLEDTIEMLILMDAPIFLASIIILWLFKKKYIIRRFNDEPIEEGEEPRLFPTAFFLVPACTEAVFGMAVVLLAHFMESEYLSLFFVITVIPALSLASNHYYLYRPCKDYDDEKFSMRDLKIITLVSSLILTAPYLLERFVLYRIMAL